MHESVKIKIARNNILLYLNMSYPGGLRAQYIYENLMMMDESYQWVLLQKDIAYLRDKGYIERVDDKLGGQTLELQKQTYKLTPEGKEIAEKTGFDRALEL